jgi:hypothetical protein
LASFATFLAKRSRRRSGVAMVPVIVDRKCVVFGEGRGDEVDDHDVSSQSRIKMDYSVLSLFGRESVLFGVVPLNSARGRDTK